MTEKEELYELVKQAVDEIGNKKDGVVEPPAPQKLYATIDGTKYEFDTQEQMDAALTQLAHTFRTQLEAASKPAPENKGGFVSGKENEPAFNPDEYIDLMHKDILKAQNYALDGIFGMPDAAKTIKASIEENKNLKSTVSVYQFRERHPEFQLTSENTNLIEGLRKELGQPFTLQGLEAAYGVAQSRGLLPSPQVLAYQQELIKQGILPDPNKAEGGDPASKFGAAGFPTRPNPTQTQQNGPLGFQPPPTVGRSTTAGRNYERDIEDMSTEELEKVIRQLGLTTR